MNPGKIDGGTRVLGAPAGWDAELFGECDALHIRDRAGTMESAWYPTYEEKRAIAEGQPIILTVWARSSHPPVSLNVQT